MEHCDPSCLLTPSSLLSFHLQPSCWLLFPCIAPFIPLGPCRSLSSLLLWSHLLYATLAPVSLSVTPSPDFSLLWSAVTRTKNYCFSRLPQHSMFTLKHLISPLVTTVWDALFSGKRRTEAHVTLGWGVNGGPQPDKWKHMVRTTGTIECQYKDVNRGANLLEVHEDRQQGWPGMMKTGETRTAIHEDC